MKVGIHEAKTKLSKLIPAVLAGEEVIITKAGHPLVKLVPVAEQGRKRPLGAYAGKVRIRGDLLEPLPKEIVNGFWPTTNEDASEHSQMTCSAISSDAANRPIGCLSRIGPIIFGFKRRHSSIWAVSVPPGQIALIRIPLEINSD